mmetsp:Transcript_75592/g.202378  ORF Transcript_75592/g.202378 Transcript_75592/m.202378 type:complete len:137 (-) Transcript_75592:25-435(-)
MLLVLVRAWPPEDRLCDTLAQEMKHISMHGIQRQLLTMICGTHLLSVQSTMRQHSRPIFFRERLRCALESGFCEERKPVEKSVYALVIVGYKTVLQSELCASFIPDILILTSNYSISEMQLRWYRWKQIDVSTLLF